MWLSEPHKLSISHDLRVAPEIPMLEEDGVHLLRLPWMPFESLAIEALYQAILPLEEKNRAAAIKSSENRHAFIQSRARLRWLLGHQLGLPPSEVPLAVGPYGKPHHRFNQIEFNLSHTQGVMLIGMAKGAELGVDVERLRPSRRLDALIREVFAPTEQRRFEGLAESEQQDLFLRTWTLKEAFVKATGRGIAAGLSRVVIREDFQGFEAIPEGDPSDYQVFEEALSRMRIALVHRGSPRHMRYFLGDFGS